MAEESNDTRGGEKSAALSTVKKDSPSTLIANAATSPDGAQEKRVKRTPNGMGLYAVALASCIVVVTTFGDFFGISESLKGSFTYTVGVNPMQYIIPVQEYNLTASIRTPGHRDISDSDNEEPASNHSVAMCVIQKQTIKYFEEWMLYHKAIGFDKFYVYDNQEDNEFERWLKTQSKEINDMVGNYTVWPGVKQQVKVYLDCWRKIRESKSHDWIAFFDVDEYLVIKDLEKYPTIIDFLDTLPDYQYGLAVNWVMFYFNRQMKYEDKPVTMRFQNYSLDAIPGAVKSMVRAQVAPKMKNPHFIKYKLSKQKSVYMSRDSRGNVVIDHQNPNKEVRDVALYHYVTKSLEEYKQRCGRGDVLRAQADWATMLFCQSDETILEKMGRDEPIHDDRPWRFLQERVPEYTKRYINTTT